MGKMAIPLKVIDKIGNDTDLGRIFYLCFLKPEQRNFSFIKQKSGEDFCSFIRKVEGLVQAGLIEKAPETDDELIKLTFPCHHDEEIENLTGEMIDLTSMLGS